MTSLYLPMLVGALVVNWRWPRRCSWIVSVFIVQFLHWYFVHQVQDGIYYYGSAALFDAMIVAMFSYQHTRFAYHLMAINLAAILVNLLGWIAYESYQPPEAYNVLLIGVLYVQYIRMLWVTDNERRELDADDSWITLVCWYNRLRHRADNGMEPKA